MTFICPITDMEDTKVEEIKLPIPPQFRINQIKRAVCDVWRVSNMDLSGLRRNRDAAFARFCAFTVCRDVTMATLPEIGRAFGGRDHTTVMHGLKRADQLLEHSPEFAENYESVMYRFAEIRDGLAHIPPPPKSEVVKPPKAMDIPKTKKRACLRCRETFESKHMGNRLCAPCGVQATKNSEFSGIGI